MTKYFEFQALDIDGNPIDLGPTIDTIDIYNLMRGNSFQAMRIDSITPAEIVAIPEVEILLAIVVRRVV